MIENLSLYKKNYYSQCGEDGIIERLFEICGIKDGWLIEFGAWDGKYLSNTKHIYDFNKDFKLLLIESNKERFKSLLKNYHDSNVICENLLIVVKPVNDVSDIFVESARIRIQQTLTSVLDKHKVGEISLLSIDIDGDDVDIWESLDKKYRPKFVIIEYSNWRELDKLDEFISKFVDYNLVFCTGNFIFARKDLGISSLSTPIELIRKTSNLDFQEFFGEIGEELQFIKYG